MNVSNDTLSTLEAALRNGGKLHAFRSGGGLRVVRVENGRLVAYGEHLHIEEAMDMAACDYHAGQRVYNPETPDPHFLTGESSSSGDLDAWILQGRTFDAQYSPADGMFEVELHGYSELKVPQEHVDAVLDDMLRGSSGGLVWRDERGVGLLTKPCRLPDGSFATSTSVLSCPEGLDRHDVWGWDSFRLGRGATLREAFKAALVAKEEPIHRRPQ